MDYFAVQVESKTLIHLCITLWKRIAFTLILTVCSTNSVTLTVHVILVIKLIVLNRFLIKVIF